jgi:[ribosomal protein S5]-alanine N-acetyltransferase
MIILETNRLVLSELAIADAPFILELVNTPGWLQFIGDRNIKDITAAENYIINGPMASYAAYGHGLYLVSLKGTTPIGICGIIKRATLEHADIGFALLPAYTGKGYALEAAAAVLQHTKEIPGLTKILAITLEENQRSVNLLIKLGMQFEKKIRLTPGEKELMLFTTG